MNNTEFDIAPLGWIHAEIGHAINEVDGALNSYDPAQHNTDALRKAGTFLHQITGAVDMVELRGVAQVSRETEQLAIALEQSVTTVNAQHIDLIHRAVNDIGHYLDELLQGKPHLELRLLPVYRELRLAQGVGQVSDSDLFFPDTEARPSGLVAQTNLNDAERIAHYKTARAQFQRGLLAFLRQQNADQGLAAMHDALHSVESLMTTSTSRTFWWSATAFVDSLATHSIEPDFTIKQLCGRIDMQLRRHIQGSSKIAERLLRDILYFIARSRDGSARISEVKQTFNLPSLLPETNLSSTTEPAIHAALVHCLHHLSKVKESWSSFVSGHAGALQELSEHLRQLQTNTEHIPQASIHQLVTELLHTTEHWEHIADARKEIVQLELTTALLLLENDFEHYDRIQDELHEQADLLRQRLHAAAWSESDITSIGAGIPLLDTISRQAQERLLTLHMAQEMQTSLRHIEEILDAFFRDSQHDRQPLTALDKPLREIIGALRIMQWEDAVAALDAATQRIKQLADPDHPIDETQFIQIADIISAMSLYIDAQRFQQHNADAVLQPILQQLGLRASPAELQRTAEHVEDDINTLREELSLLALDWQTDPTDNVTKKKLIELLQRLNQDAELTADNTLKGRTDFVLQFLKQPDAPDTLQADVWDTLRAIAGIPLPAATPLLAEPEPVTAHHQEIIDKELLEIFLEEASEVLEEMYQGLLQLEHNEYSPAILRDIRRNFHTLKGSGRMVKLNDLGETAWAIEQLLNLWLQQTRALQPELLALLQRAHALFAIWIATLNAQHPFGENYSALSADADQLRASISEPAPEAATETEATETEATETEATGTEAVESALLPPVVAEYFAENVPDYHAEIHAEHDTEAATQTEEIPLADSVPTEHFATAETISEDNLPDTTDAPAQDITIGEAQVPAALLDIFLQEARQHLQTLNQELTQHQEHPSHAVSHDFMRAAHTLAGTARLTGFTPLAELSHALEIWLFQLHNAQQPLPESNYSLVDKTIATLRDMVDHIQRHQFPNHEPELIAALQHAQQQAQTHAQQEPLTMAEPAAEHEFLAALEESTPAQEKNSDEPKAEYADASDAEARNVATSDMEPAVETPAAPVTDTVTNIDTDISSDATTAPSPLSPTFAPPPSAANKSEPVLSINDDVDPQLLEIFLEEASDLMPAISQTLHRWHHQPSEDTRPEIQRLLHTLKGSARMAGAMRLGDLTHDLETQIVQRNDIPQLDKNDFETFEAQIDQLNLMVEQLRNPILTTAASTTAYSPSPSAATDTSPGIPSAMATQALGLPQTFTTADNESNVQLLRVRADIVDQLVNEAGEISIARSRIESSTTMLRNHTIELTENAERLRAQLRELEIQAESQMQSSLSHRQTVNEQFDPLEFDRFTRLQELTRMIAESLNDIQTVQHNLLLDIDETDAALTQQNRMTKNLQQELMHVRMMPLSHIAERLHRTVRLAAKEGDKKVSLQLSGASVELDRTVLDKLVAPIEHLLRNSVAHGIERPKDRIQAHKSEYGEITLTARQADNEIILTLRDDGQGLDYTAIRQRAIQNGLIDADAQLSEDALGQLIFTTGFSTADQITTLSGRGVGMDVVKSDITHLGGRVAIHSVAGQGMQTTLYLPLTLATTQAVMVHVDQRTFAIASAMIEQVQEYKPADLPALFEHGSINWLNNNYPLYYLPHLFDEAAPIPRQHARNPILLLRSGAARAAILVDRLTGNQEIVIKNIGTQLINVPGISGATVLGNGQIVLILNLVHLAEQRALLPHHPVPTQPVAVEATRPTVMVVDDSLTVRKITTRLLQREGYDVLTAKDGIDALQMLQTQKPDVILLDIEMPRMDGFEVTKNIRHDEHLRHIPIIMITSRTADKHRDHALSLGVNDYMGKPYQEEALLARIAELLPSNVHSTTAGEALA